VTWGHAYILFGSTLGYCASLYSLWKGLTIRAKLSVKIIEPEFTTKPDWEENPVSDFRCRAFLQNGGNLLDTMIEVSLTVLNSTPAPTAKIRTIPVVRKDRTYSVKVHSEDCKAVTIESLKAQELDLRFFIWHTIDLPNDVHGEITFKFIKHKPIKQKIEFSRDDVRPEADSGLSNN
jgi:hypothetical protein